MKVLGSKLLVQVEKGCTQKMGGFEIPIEDVEVAKVITLGEDLANAEVIKEGDTIYLYTGAGKVIFVEGIEYRVITSNEVIVIL